MKKRDKSNAEQLQRLRREVGRLEKARERVQRDLDRMQCQRELEH